jgi:hypothetical protein
MRPIRQQPLQDLSLGKAQRAFGVDEVHEARIESLHGGLECD